MGDYCFLYATSVAYRNILWLYFVKMLNICENNDVLLHKILTSLSDCCIFTLVKNGYGDVYEANNVAFGNVNFCRCLWR